MAYRTFIYRIFIYLSLCSLQFIVSSLIATPSIQPNFQSNKGLAHVVSNPLLFLFSKSKPKNFAAEDIPDVWNIQPPRRAIVTGANTGIGFETAKELARKGWHVILAAR